MTKQDLTAIISNSCPHCVRCAKDFGLDIVKSDTDVTKEGPYGTIRLLANRETIEAENLMAHTRKGVPAILVKRDDTYYPCSIGYSNKDELLAKANRPINQLKKEKEIADEEFSLQMEYLESNKYLELLKKKQELDLEQKNLFKDFQKDLETRTKAIKEKYD